MAWKIEFDRKALKELKKLSPKTQHTILRYLKERIAPLQDPRDLGKPLVGTLSGLWRYRLGDYRIICKLSHGTLTVTVIRIAHRREVYHP